MRVIKVPLKQLSSHTITSHFKLFTFIIGRGTCVSNYSDCANYPNYSVAPQGRVHSTLNTQDMKTLLLLVLQRLVFGDQVIPKPLILALSYLLPASGCVSAPGNVRRTHLPLQLPAPSGPSFQRHPASHGGPSGLTGG